MSIAPAAPPPLSDGTPVVRRVRHQARDAAALMAFSALASLGVAAGFLVLAALARQA